jgi:hypothetical protein
MAAFNHTWVTTPSIAWALGNAITISGTNVGSELLGWVKIPGFIIQGIDAVGFRGRLQTFAGDLMEAGNEAAPGSLVSIQLIGSLKYGLRSDIKYEVED